MFNPTTKNCTDYVKSVNFDGKCQSYKECLYVFVQRLFESAPLFGKWTELSCESGFHLDKESQKCIRVETSTCGKHLKDFIFQVVSRSLFIMQFL